MMPTLAQDSLLEFLNASAAAQDDDLISFAAGMPDSACINDYAVDGMIRAFHDSRVSAGESAAAIDLRQYGPTRGVITPHIRRHLGNDYGIGLPEEGIVVTNGAQEALTVLTWSLLDARSECLLVPDPCFPGAHEAARQLGIEVIGFPCGPDALDRGALERAAATARARGKRAGALYMNPTYGNPLGGTLGRADREYVNEFALRHDLWVFEDDPYGLFSYEGHPPPPLAALPANGKTFFVGSFSKSISPSLRAGFIAAPGADRGLMEHLSRAKSTLSLHTSQVCQAIVGGVLHASGYTLRRRCAENARLYRRKRDELARALRQEADRSIGLRLARWTIPAGGFFVPLELPRPFRRDDLVALRDEFGVLVTPMSEFSVCGARANAIRLAFSAVPLDKIRPGVERLAAFLSREA
jgi:(S)-3,5-dihydroxyphenylglycine transaminase